MYSSRGVTPGGAGGVTPHPHPNDDLVGQISITGRANSAGNVNIRIKRTLKVLSRVS